MGESTQATGEQELAVSSPPPPYQYQTAEFGFFAEIYLPKRTEYQGILSGTLVNGFKFKTKVIKGHFNKQGIAARVLRYLEHYPEINKKIEKEDDKAARLRNIDQTFFGYSMYEVDGVFWSNERKRAIEERTLVIRLMFVPRDFEKEIERIKSSEEYKNHKFKFEYSEAKNYARKYLAADTYEEDILKSRAKNAFEKKRPNWWKHRMNQYVDRWVTDCAIFTFGYLLFKICERIGNLLEPEEEIWVTSFWNLHVNKVIKTKK